MTLCEGFSSRDLRTLVPSAEGRKILFLAYCYEGLCCDRLIFGQKKSVLPRSNTNPRSYFLVLAEKNIEMGVATSSIISSYGLAVGVIPTYNALLGASATILASTDAMIENMKMAPLFDWFFGKRILKDKSLRTRARIVAMIELLIGLGVLFPQDDKNKLIGLVSLTMFFAYLAVGSAQVKDFVGSSVTATMACCAILGVMGCLMNDNPGA
jgi:hypothetical protein